MHKPEVAQKNGLIQETQMRRLTNEIGPETRGEKGQLVVDKNIPSFKSQPLIHEVEKDISNRNLWKFFLLEKCFFYFAHFHLRVTFHMFSKEYSQWVLPSPGGLLEIEGHWRTRAAFFAPAHTAWRPSKWKWPFAKGQKGQSTDVIPITEIPCGIIK